MSGNIVGKIALAIFILICFSSVIKAREVWIYPNPDVDYLWTSGVTKIQGNDDQRSCLRTQEGSEGYHLNIAPGYTLKFQLMPELDRGVDNTFSLFFGCNDEGEGQKLYIEQTEGGIVCRLFKTDSWDLVNKNHEPSAAVKVLGQDWFQIVITPGLTEVTGSVNGENLGRFPFLKHGITMVLESHGPGYYIDSLVMVKSEINVTASSKLTGSATKKLKNPYATGTSFPAKPIEAPPPPPAENAPPPKNTSVWGILADQAGQTAPTDKDSSVVVSQDTSASPVSSPWEIVGADTTDKDSLTTAVEDTVQTANKDTTTVNIPPLEDKPISEWGKLLFPTPDKNP